MAHLKGFSRVWLLMCRVKCSRRMKEPPQTEHGCPSLPSTALLSLAISTAADEDFVCKARRDDVRQAHGMDHGNGNGNGNGTHTHSGMRSFGVGVGRPKELAELDLRLESCQEEKRISLAALLCKSGG
ncbi:hypothetical protein E4U41_002812 [Claviceps citrina]|nr:hypothetical protein E4U41_002812 [Claviceps citrina]